MFRFLDLFFRRNPVFIANVVTPAPYRGTGMNARVKECLCRLGVLWLSESLPLV